METKVIDNTDLHFEHKQWRSELAFWEDELRSYTNRLEELVMRFTNKEVLAQLEHYQNTFIRHSEVIDTLQHDINVHEADMSAHNKKHEEVLNTALAKNHIEFRDRIETQRHIYADLKKEFFRFLSKYM